MFQKKTSSAVTCGHGDPTTCRGCWRSYPQGQFSNWTKLQQQKSKIGKLIDRPATGRCTILTVDALKDGSIVRPEQHTIDDPSEEDTFWEKFMRKVRCGIVSSSTIYETLFSHRDQRTRTPVRGFWTISRVLFYRCLVQSPFFF